MSDKIMYSGRQMSATLYEIHCYLYCVSDVFLDGGEFRINVMQKVLYYIILYYIILYYIILYYIQHNGDFSLGNKKKRNYIADTMSLNVLQTDKT